MDFKFDADQEYQIAAIDAVASLFEGQPRFEVGVSFALGGLAAVPNRLDLDADALLANLHAVQARHDLAPDNALRAIEGAIDTVEGPQTIAFPNFSTEMETGTGKTYVYLRTALELHARYGFRKYIVVVPSVAVREGVLKTLQITEGHLRALYGNPPYRYYAYDSANLTQVRQFALSDGVEIMVMTIDSFNKASNVIRQSTDRLQGETPIHLVQAARPILILDEPQNMESEARIAALAALNPLCALRYSATHRNPYNLVYRLTPYEAYRQGLVKRIEVASVLEEGETSQAFVRLVALTSQKKTVSAKVAVHQLMKTSAIKEKVITVRAGDELRAKTERREYAEYVVEEINPGGGFLRFANGVELRIGQTQGADKEALFAAQIRYTVEEHFRKQARLAAAGIKVLSLFFIDRVANYAPEDGVIRQLFVQAFDELKAKYPAWADREASEVQAAYFAQRRQAGNVVQVDSVSGKTQEDEAAYSLIMRDKERLLSFAEPVAFIFSHSALREGWDNPNVCQICTLNQTASETKKRQEIGRGMRLVVNQAGERLHEERVNVLTVVANESYEQYVATLQEEVATEYGPGEAAPKPANARKRGVARLRKAHLLSPEFKELWERIGRKTSYSVDVDTEKLLADALPEIDALRVRPPRLAITKSAVRVGDEDVFEAVALSGAKTVADLSGRYPLPNLIDVMANLMEHTTPSVCLTRKTLLAVYQRTTNQAAALDNPQDFATGAVRILKQKMTEQLVAGIKYEPIAAHYEMTLFDEEITSYEEHLVPANGALYDAIVCDSGPERDFVAGLEMRRDVKLYIKLPDWFTVRTPVGEYNPDWAIVMVDTDEHGDGHERLYLVRETKSTTDRGKLRTDERHKVFCGERHFADALGVDYKVVTSAGELP